MVFILSLQRRDTGLLKWRPSARITPPGGASSVVWRVDEAGGSLPEPVLEGKPMSALAVSKDALYFGTRDGEVAKLAKPLALPGSCGWRSHPTKTCTGWLDVCTRRLS